MVLIKKAIVIRRNHTAACIQTSVRHQGDHDLQAFIKRYISSQDAKCMFWKNGKNGELRPVLLLEKRQETLFLFALLKSVGK